MSVVGVEKPGKLEAFASLDWLEEIISFLFRLLAKLAEPFLAFGLIASAIDYGSHGQFLGAHKELLMVWMVTQGLALEGSGGVCLAMSFEAREQGDSAKVYLQRSLAITLLAVGGVMFFVELVSSMKSFNEASLPDWYIYVMSAARTVVSLGYIAICRTRKFRFSRYEPQTVAAQQVQTTVEMIAEQLRTDVRAMVQQVQQVQTNQEVHVAVAPPDESLRLIEQALASAMRTVTSEVQEALRTVISEVQAVPQHALPEPRVRKVNLVAQGSVESVGSLPQTQGNTEPLAIVNLTDGSKRAMVHAFILEVQRRDGRMPTLEEIMTACECAKNTAIRYRRELLQEGGNA